MFLEPYAEYGELVKQRKSRPKIADNRHKINGLITRLFCAECFSFAKTGDYGCYIWVTRFGSNVVAVFVGFHKPEKLKNKNIGEIAYEKQQKYNFI